LADTETHSKSGRKAAGLSARTIAGILVLSSMIAVPVCLPAQTSAPSPASSAKSNQGTSKEATPSTEKGRLPEEGLKTAQQAEKYLAQNQPAKAIQTLLDLDKKYPGHAAVSLRLAQIYDTNNNLGPALFFYRRYIAIVGPQAPEEVQARASTLELMPDAKSGAQKIATKMNLPAAPVATPAPLIERTVNVMRKDGSLVKLEGPADVEKITKSGIPPATPVTVTPAATPIVFPTLPEASPKATSAGSGQDHYIRGSVTSEEHPTAKTASTRDEDAMIARAIRHESTPTTSAPDAPVVDKTDTAATGNGENVAALQNPDGAQVSSAQNMPLPVSQGAGATLPSLSQSPVPQAEREDSLPKDKYGRPMAVTSPDAALDDLSPRARKFFQVKDAGGVGAGLKIINALKNAVVTLNVIPDDDRDSDSAIMMPGEDKNIRLQAGSYDVHVSVSTTDYPPQPLMNTHFKYVFENGKQYFRRMTPDNLQQLN